MLSKYYIFLLEKKEDNLLEMINESLFVMSSKMSEIINNIEEYDNNSSSSSIASCFGWLNNEDVDTNISYFDLSDNNSSVTFLDPKKMEELKRKNRWRSDAHIFNKIKGNSIRIGRLTRKVIEIYNKIKLYPKNFSDKEIEMFVNSYKSQYDFINNIMDNFEFIKGDDIINAYSGDNYYNTDGNLGNSCMRNSDCVDFFDIYTENDNVELLVLYSPNKKIMGRSIIWTFGDKRFMDRIYVNRDSDTNVFIDYAKKNNFIYKSRQDYDKNTRLRIPYDSYSGTHKLKFETNVGRFLLENKKDYCFPYLDTMKFLYFEEGILRNWEIKTKHYVSLEDTDGGSYCYKCEGSGYINCEEIDPECNDGRKVCNRCLGFSNKWG